MNSSEKEIKMVEELALSIQARHGFTSYGKLAKAAGLSHNAIYDIINLRTRVRPKTVQRVKSMLAAYDLELHWQKTAVKKMIKSDLNKELSSIVDKFMNLTIELEGLVNKYQL